MDEQILALLFPEYREETIDHITIVGEDYLLPDYEPVQQDVSFAEDTN